MCSNECKCNEEIEKIWSTEPEAYLRTYTRTKNANNEEKTAYESDGVNAAIIPFVYSTDISEYVSTFIQCYNEKLKEKIESEESSNANSDYVKNAKDFFEKGGYQMLRKFEETYDCAGICYKPLFYISKDVSEGSVKRTCEDAIVEEYTGNIGTAVFAALCALTLLIAVLGSCTLLSGYDEDDMMRENRSNVYKEED